MRAAFALFVLSPLVSAQIAYPDFTNVSGLSLVPNAAQSGNVLRLTNSVISTRGAAWWSAPVPVAGGFDTTFRWQTSAPIGGGGDGFTFTIHTDPRGTAALGNHASALCYSAFPTSPATTAIWNSLVVEFDMYYTNFGGYTDLGANEISIHTAGAGANSHSEGFSIGRVAPAASMKNGLIHTGRIRYVPGTIEVYYDNLQTPVLSAPYRFSAGGVHILTSTPVGGIPLFGGSAYVGFTGSGGSAYMNQDLLDWSFASAGFDSCHASQFGADVVSISGNSGGGAHFVDVPANASFSIDVTVPPGAAAADYLLFLKVGAPAAGGAYALPWGSMCFAPSVLVPDPSVFLLMDTLFGGGLLPALPAPYAFPFPGGIPTPLLVTLQGVMVASPGVGNTNAVVLQVF